MMYLKIVNEPYNTTSDVGDLINYAECDKSEKRFTKTNIYTGGANIFDPYDAESEFMMVKEHFGKTSGRQVRHIILSPDPKDMFIPGELYELALYICAYYADRFQIIFSVHTDLYMRPHLHFVMNTVSFIDGTKLHDTFAEQAEFRKYCNTYYNIIKGRSKWIKKQLNSF